MFTGPTLWSTMCCTVIGMTRHLLRRRWISMELDGELIQLIIYVQSEIDCDDGRKVSIMTFGPISIAPFHTSGRAMGKQLL